jgi:hypothetical protein
MTHPFSPELIVRLRLLWLASIEEVASLELQRVGWLNPTNTNPHWSYIELAECYFEQFELGNGYGFAVENGIVSASEAAAAAAFHALFAAYEPPKGDNYNGAAILADPKWLAVSSAASEALENILLLSFNHPTYLGAFRAEAEPCGAGDRANKAAPGH